MGRSPPSVNASPPVMPSVRTGTPAPLADQRADEIAVAPLALQVDRRRRPLLALADLAQIERLSEPAAGLANEQDRLVGGLERNRCRLGEVGEHADAADRRRRQDRAP